VLPSYVLSLAIMAKDHFPAVYANPHLLGNQVGCGYWRHVVEVIEVEGAHEVDELGEIVGVEGHDLVHRVLLGVGAFHVGEMVGSLEFLAVEIFGGWGLENFPLGWG